MRTSKRQRVDAPSDTEFEHSSRHVDLDSLLSEHLGGKRASESIISGFETQRKAREERTARRGY
jgi:hypothetical protein